MKGAIINKIFITIIIMITNCAKQIVLTVSKPLIKSYLTLHYG